MIGAQKRYPDNFSITQVYVREAEEGDHGGFLVHPGTGLAWPFGNVLDLMDRYEQLFNGLDYPQATHRMRTMGDNTPAKEMINLRDKSVDFAAKPNEKPTFIVKIHYRQNASWQGTIQWVEKNITQSFRSTLELIKLIDSAVGEAEVKWE